MPRPLKSHTGHKFLHLKNCQCLEKEAQELVEFYTSSLKEYHQKLAKECKCVKSEKPRTPFYDYDNYGYTYCERCEERIAGAGKMGIITLKPLK